MTIFKKHSPQQIDSESLVELIPTQEMPRFVLELQKLVEKSKSSKSKQKSIKKSVPEIKDTRIV